MRILYLTQVLHDPLNAGPKTRAYQELRYLSQHRKVTLVSIARADDRPMAGSICRRSARRCIPCPCIAPELRMPGISCAAWLAALPSSSPVTRCSRWLR
jgi:hypothetical protein